MPEKPKEIADRTQYKPWSRQEIADFLIRREAEIRSLARRYMRGHRQRFSDSEDVFASVCRRLDGVAAEGRLRPRHEDEVWALTAQVVANNALNRSRLLNRLRSREMQNDGDLLAPIVERCGGNDEVALLLHRVVSQLNSGPDRQIFVLRLRGATHEAIGAHLGTSGEAVRHRWSRILATIRELNASGEFDDG